jgi:DNA-binding MarR family transcriptional regulator
MHVKLVIDAIVRQTTVLIAQLATSAGMRAPLAHIAGETFLSLTRELERQGLAQKVIADMFGLALRSYQQKVERLSESATDRGRTLWEAIYDYVQSKQVASRAEVLMRFVRDDHASVRGILSDLVDSGLVYKAGRGDTAVYRIASADDLGHVGATGLAAAAEGLVWVTVYRDGPLSEREIGERLALSPDAVSAALATLSEAGHVLREPDGEPPRYGSQRCLIPLEQSAGWEAALLDHYQAVVRSMCIKLNQGTNSASLRDRLGGSTYSFDVWPGHKYEQRVYALLAEHRTALSAFWNEVSEHNRHERKPAAHASVTFYFGQSVATEDQGANHEQE